MKIRIGTRGSKLALVQTATVSDALRSAHPDLVVESIDIKTIGDLKQGTPLASKGDKKDWIYELELGVLGDHFDLVVHSGKDIPSDIEKGTETMPVLERVNPNDCFIGRIVNGRRLSFKELPDGAIVGTASLRRRASLLRIRPDLNVVEHRGNVTTRIEKLDASPTMMGIIIASAGLERLNLSNVTWENLSPSDLIPAINQGTLVVQFREDRDDVRQEVKALIHPPTYATWAAERACCVKLQGDCRSCISIFASIEGDMVRLTSRVMSLNGKTSLEYSAVSSFDRAHELGTTVGDTLVAQGARKIIEESRKDLMT